MATPAPTVKQLRYFVHVVDAGSISRAADQLHVAQTALGIQIRMLEQGLATVLLRRHHNGVTVTKAGRYIYDRACQILQSVDALAEEVASLAAGARREVSLGLTPTLMHGIGPRAVREADRRVPGMHLHLAEGLRDQLIRGMEAGEFDYIFTHDVGSGGALRAMPILRQPLVLVSRPGTLPDRRPISFAAALATDLVVRRDSSHALDIVSRTALGFGLVPNIVYEIDSLPGLNQMIIQYGSTSIMPSDYVVDAVARGELEIHDIVDPPLEMTLEFIMHSAQPPTEAEFPLLAFLDDLLDDFFREIGAESRRLGHLTGIVMPSLAQAKTA
uniref:LysR family transcriptional regulator n=1 Tax=Pararhizobium sp. IMCC3301 TaxID=3067904 RepID=UPI00274199DE|nr:LysR family transcriptional regulator [Pararhizobium sp. IMCC3301]